MAGATLPRLAPTAARVRLVVLNYDGGDDVVRCVEHLAQLDWPVDRLELVVVDNASADGSVEAIEAAVPRARVIRLERNRGFPANNVALTALDDVDYVGLVNNDAFVTPGYLGPLVDALDADASLGAACPRILFADAFVDLAITAPAARPGRGDPRELGVKVSGLRVDGQDRWRQAQVAEGGHGAETSPAGRYEWTGSRAVLRVPTGAPGPVGATGPTAARVSVRLSAVEAKQATLGSGDGAVVADVTPEPRWFDVEVTGRPYDVVNNAGSVVLPDGYGADRGFGQPDGEPFDEPAEVFAWCGGAVLLRPAYLADVGLFAERLFLYYEDTDLSWRGQARGWRYRYVPDAVVRHRHAATSVEGSARFHRFTERNRLLMLVRNAPRGMVEGAVRRYLGETYDAARRDIAGALAQGRRPNPLPVWRRVRAFSAFLRLLPWASWSRRSLRVRQAVPDALLVARVAEAPPGATPPSR